MEWVHIAGKCRIRPHRIYWGDEMGWGGIEYAGGWGGDADTGIWNTDTLLPLDQTLCSLPSHISTTDINEAFKYIIINHTRVDYFQPLIFGSCAGRNLIVLFLLSICLELVS